MINLYMTKFKNNNNNNNNNNKRQSPKRIITL